MEKAGRISLVYETLLGHFGRQRWWPVKGSGDPAFEIAAGAILTQQTQWRNVEVALANLEKNGLLNPHGILNAEKETVENLVRSTGFYRQKAGRLVGFCRWLVENHDGRLSHFFDTGLKDARNELLRLKGVGPETADSILLYGGGKPVFVIDAYTKRLCRRLGISESEDYEELRSLFENNIPKDAEIYKEIHALIVEHGKRFCRTKPACGGCPLGEGCDHNKNNPTNNSS